MVPKVLVLMATYNGEQFLRQQIDSVLNQKNIDVYIKVADDLSNDNTKAILEEYNNKYENFEYYINDKNKHFTYNFIDLLFSEKNSEFDYYAFSDQDDVWLDDKLYNAIRKIQEEKRCKNGCMYCSNLELVDENLNHIGFQETDKVLKLKRYSFLTSNIATGCTIVFNHDFLKHVTKHYPEKIYLHDYWLFLISLYTADLVYDYNSYILYRQHSSNLIGSNKKIFSRKRINNFLKPRYKTSNLLKEFIRLYSKDIYEKDIKYIEIASQYDKSFLKKMRLLFSHKIYKRRFNFLFKIQVLLKKY